MKKYFRQIQRSKAIKTTLIVAGAGLVVLFVSYANAVADGPTFNIFPITYIANVRNNDLAMIDIKNVTKGTGYSVSAADHSNGIQADPGDVLEVSIYYHNGAVDLDANIARNVVINSAIVSPSGTTSLTYTASARITASNMSAVQSAQKGGDMQVSITGSTPQTIALVPGSVFWYKDFGTNPGASPQSITGPILGNGVALGDVRGSFAHSGFINFQVQVSSNVPPEGTLQIAKDVRNATNATAYQATSVTADPGDLLDFRLTFSAQTDPVEGVRIKDSMDSRLSLSGTVLLDGSTTLNASEFFGSGTSVGNLSAGQSHVITYSARVAAVDQFPVGTHSVNNQGNVFNDHQSVSDQAAAIVTVAESPPPTVEEIHLTKTVQNLNAGGGFASNISADPGDRLRFQISIDPGQSDMTLYNVILSDALPDKLTYLSGSLRIDGTVTLPEDLFGSDKSLGSISPGVAKIVTFDADVAGNTSFAVGCETLTNSATVVSTGAGESANSPSDYILNDQDSAAVQVCKTAPVKDPGTPSQRP